MSANLITGNLFKPIYAYQDADYQAGISGNVTSIMPVGSQMALSIEDANTIKADDGVLITKEGRRIQIDAGAIEEWSIPTGTQGQTNYYIVGFRLYTDNTSAEVCETFVEQMENATDTIPENTFRSGATEVYISLGRVVQNGINLESVTSLVQTAQSFEDVRNAIAQLNTEAIKNITRSGTTFTATRSDGTTFTFDQQDNYCGYSQALIQRCIGTTGGLTEGIPNNIGKNLNNISWNSEYNIPSGSGVANMPVDTWGFVVTRCHIGGSHWRRQDFYDMVSDRVWTRRLPGNGSWTSWVLVGPPMPNYGAKVSTYGKSYTAPYNCVVYLVCNTSMNYNIKVSIDNTEVTYFQVNNGTGGTGGILLPAGKTLTTDVNCSIYAFPIT